MSTLEVRDILRRLDRLEAQVNNIYNAVKEADSVFQDASEKPMTIVKAPERVYREKAEEPRATTIPAGKLLPNVFIVTRPGISIIFDILSDFKTMVERTLGNFQTKRTIGIYANYEPTARKTPDRGIESANSFDKKIYLAFSKGNGVGQFNNDAGLDRFGYETGFIFELECSMRRVNWAVNKRAMEEFVAYLRQN